MLAACLADIVGHDRLELVRELARAIGVMHEAGEARPGTRDGPLQHLEVTVGVAERAAIGRRPMLR